MIQSLDDAKEELKRVDHLIYVSLKYTRTVDVLINIIRRMIDCHDYLMECLLKYALEKKMISEIPGTPKEKGHKIKELFLDQEVHNNINLYFLLKNIYKSTYYRENEYRRHVTLRTTIGGREELLNIDIISEYYMIQRNFLFLVEKIIQDKYIPGSNPPVEKIIPEMEEIETPEGEEGKEGRGINVVKKPTPKKKKKPKKPVKKFWKETKKKNYYNYYAQPVKKKVKKKKIKVKKKKVKKAKVKKIRKIAKKTIKKKIKTIKKKKKTIKKNIRKKKGLLSIFKRK